MSDEKGPEQPSDPRGRGTFTAEDWDGKRAGPPRKRERKPRQDKAEEKAWRLKNFNPFIREADAMLAALGDLSALRQEMPTVGEGAGAHTDLILARSGLLEVVCWYQFAGASRKQICEMLNVKPYVLTKIVKDPRFLPIYEEQKRLMLGKIDEAIADRLREVGFEALELKIKLMRTARNAWLRSKIASELLELALAVNKGKRTGLTDDLKAVWKRAIRKKLPDGSTQTETVSVVAPVEGADAKIVLPEGES